MDGNPRIKKAFGDPESFKAFQSVIKPQKLRI